MISQKKISNLVKSKRNVNFRIFFLKNFVSTKFIFLLFFSRRHLHNKNLTNFLLFCCRTKYRGWFFFWKILFLQSSFSSCFSVDDIYTTKTWPISSCFAVGQNIGGGFFWKSKGCVLKVIIFFQPSKTYAEWVLWFFPI